MRSYRSATGSAAVCLAAKGGKLNVPAVADQDRRGSTILEMAVVAPVVLTLLLGMLDLGVAVYAYNTVAEAARAGTRYAIVHGAKDANPVGPSSNNSKVENVVRGYSPGIISSDLTVSSSWPDGDNEPGSKVSVTVTYNYKPAVTWFVGFQTLKLNGTSTMVITH